MKLNEGCDLLNILQTHLHKKSLQIKGSHKYPPTSCAYVARWFLLDYGLILLKFPHYVAYLKQSTGLLNIFLLFL